MGLSVLTEKRFFEWHEDETSVTLRNKGGSYGGGSECLVIQTFAELSVPMTEKELIISMSQTEN